MKTMLLTGLFTVGLCFNKLTPVPCPSEPKVDEPAVFYKVPAPRPCNIHPEPDANGYVSAICITGPETHRTCRDKHRILLQSEDNTWHCIDPRLLGR